jgi:hypothetical protein
MNPVKIPPTNDCKKYGASSLKLFSNKYEKNGNRNNTDKIPYKME